MLYLNPELVKMEHAVDDPDRTIKSVFSYPVPQTSLNGVTGNPSTGNAEDGEALFQKMTTALSEKIKSALTEEPPLTSCHWHSIC